MTEEKENAGRYALIALAVIVVIGLALYTQYKISATNSALDKLATGMIAAKTTGAQQTSPSGISPQMGISYDTQGYNTLLNYYKTINLDTGQSKTVAGLDVELPCCGFKDIITNSDGTANFPASCHCGHHDAMYGLAMYMVQKGYSREEMQKELNVWKEVFFPSQGGGNLGGCA